MNPVFIIVPALMLTRRRPKRRKRRMLGDIGYDEAKIIMSRMTPIEIKEVYTAKAVNTAPQFAEPEIDLNLVDFDQYKCDVDGEILCPLLDFDMNDEYEEDEELYEDSSDYDEEMEAEHRERDPHPDRDEALARCDKFLNAIIVRPQAADELSINEIAVSQTIMPAMKKMASALARSSGSLLDPEDHGIELVLAGLESVAPACGWAFHEEDSSWTYAYGEPVQGDHVEVLESMFPLAVAAIEEINKEEQGKNG